MSAENIVFNTCVPKANHVANFLILVTKHYIYVQRCKKCSLSMYELKSIFNNIENVEKYIAIRNNKLVKHNKKWSNTQASENIHV